MIYQSSDISLTKSIQKIISDFCVNRINDTEVLECLKNNFNYTAKESASPLDGIVENHHLLNGSDYGNRSKKENHDSLDYIGLEDFPNISPRELYRKFDNNIGHTETTDFNIHTSDNRVNCRSSPVLIVECYSSILHAYEEQPIYIVTVNKSLPKSPLLAAIGSQVIKLNEKEKLLHGMIMCQNPEHCFLKLSTTKNENSESVPVYFKMSHSDSSVSLLDSLPVIIINPPNIGRLDPKLCYMRNQLTNKLDNKVANTKTQKMILPKASKFNASKVIIKEKISQNNNKILAKIQKNPSIKSTEVLQSVKFGSYTCAINNNMLREVKLFFATMDTAVCDSVIPFELRAYIYLSCPLVNRLGVLNFHDNLYKMLPFNISAAHIFTKTSPLDMYSIFGFSLTPTYDTSFQRDISKSIPTRFVASLDRFQASERNMSDVRFWNYIDGFVCSKNYFAANYRINEENGMTQSAPTPTPLLQKFYGKEKALCVNNKATIRIASDIYLHWEPWPKSHLPIHNKYQINGNMTNNIESTADMSTVNSKYIDDSNYFGFTLCIGDLIFTSVTGISETVLKFIINDWLKWVRGDFAYSKT